MYHPWRALRGLAGWTVIIAELPPGQRGRTRWSDRTITLAPGQSQAERRATLAHEVLHAERPRFLEGWRAQEEQRVRVLAAHRLITLDALIDALRWAHTIEELAEELWVDVDTAQTRLDHLHPSERARITGALRDRD